MSTPARAASSRLAYSGGGAIRYASVIHRRSVALAVRSWTARYMRARPGTRDRTRAVGEPPPLAPRGAERPEGTVQDTHPDPGAGPLDQRVGEAPAGRVVADDVVLEVHPAARRGDRGEHRVQGARAVGVVLEAIAVDGPGARRAVDGEGERVAGGGRGGGGK